VKPPDALLAVLITAIWGFNYSVIKLGLTNVDPLVLAGIRFSLCAFPAVLFVKRPNTGWRYIIAYGLIFGVGLWGVVNLGIRAGISAGLASLVLQFSACFTMLLGALVFRESLTRYQHAGIALALIGLCCTILVTDGTATPVGLALVLVGAASWSIANIIIKKSQTKEVFSFLVWSSVFSPIPLFVLALASGGPAAYTSLVRHLDATVITSVLFQAYPNTIFGYWVWNSLLRKYAVSSVAPLSLLVPIFGMVGSMLIFGERLEGAKLLAFGLIVSGLVVGLYGKRIRHVLFGTERKLENLEQR
jgi:O-acetylserine/cysteine efflux transporter